MRKLLIFFGLLDALIFIESYQQVYYGLTDWSIVNWERIESVWIHLAFLFIRISVGFSAYLLMMGNKVGIWLSYFQFPFRFLFTGLSFNFLWPLNRLFYEREFGFDFLTWTISLLEISRLIITIHIHRTNFLKPIQ